MSTTFELKDHEYIELNKLLKVLSLVDSGGQAKMMIDNGEVVVNGNVETQKRKKLRPADVVVFMGQTIEIK